MGSKTLGKLSILFSKFINGIKKRNKRGLEWVGMDGLVNMETSALLVIFLMLFFPVIWAMIVSFALVVGKSLLDKKRGKDDEIHDLICSVIGVFCGVILGMAHAVVVLR